MEKNLLFLFLILLIFIFSTKIFSSEKELIGELTPDQILAELPEWKKLADQYSPQFEIIQKLNQVNQEISIEIILGTWCKDSKQHVPSFIKIIQMIDNPSISVRLIGVPKKKETRDKRLIEEKNIKRIPTFIVCLNGEEKGRIIETPTLSIEEDLFTIIQSQTSNSK
ncbi:MAG: thioredoxin family protein [Candidatus Aminicenantia bacterium]